MRAGKVVLVCSILLLLIVGLWFYWFLTTHGFSAREKPGAIEAFLARKVRGLATPAEAKNLKNPLSPTPLAIAEGRDHFADHCAICHANSGSGKTVINSGLYPPAPDLRQERTQQLSDGELMYIIKNGIRFTGMPGWGGGDEENWKLVLFIRHLPQLTPQELALMTEVNGLTEEEQGDSSHLAQDASPSGTSPEAHEHYK
ncbi:MAG TPA: c-type cytochrome [Methylomirabilota bacterium]|jgi:mono/diheme cytochrome c family protein|nr:c-type cytochrome [Methylomirabilota bacterium]